MSYVWSHFPRVPSVLQQHGLMLVTVEQLIRLPHLKNREQDQEQHKLLSPGTAVLKGGP